MSAPEHASLFKSFAIDLEGTKSVPVFDFNGAIGCFHRIVLSKLKELEKDADTTSQNAKSVFFTLEYQAWDLVQRLYPHRIGNTELEPVMVHAYSSASVVEQNYYRQNQEAFENYLVCTWLQDMAPLAEEPEDLSANGWINTREMIKSAALLGKKAFSPQIVTELDPDGPTRQGKNIHADDQRDEEKFYKYVFELIRSGNFDQALEICRKTNRYWLAAILQGAVEYQDPMIDTGIPGPIIGIKQKSLWRKTCFASSQNKSFDPYKRALFGAICGDIQSVLDVCENFSDSLWAFYNCMTHNEIAAMLAKAQGIESSTPILPSGLKLNKTAILEKLMKYPSTQTIKEDPWNSVGHPLRILQARIITNELELITQELYKLLQFDKVEFTNNYNSFISIQFLRFITHLLIVLKRSGISIDAEIFNVILLNYIKVLGEAKMSNIIVIYVSELPKSLGVDAYANYLQSLKTKNERLLQRKLIKKFDLDFEEIAIRVVDLNIQSFPLQTSQVIDTKNIYSEASKDELEYVNSLEWLTFEDILKEPLLLKATKLLRILFLNASIKASKNLFENVSTLLTESCLEDFVESKDIQLSSAVLEYLSYQGFIKCYTKYGESISKFQSFSASKNTSQYFSTIRDREESKLQLRAAADAIYALLNGNWMSLESLHVSGSINSLNSSQISTIRNHYISELIITLHNIYMQIGAFNNCIELTTLVADNEFMLYECLLNSNRLEEYLALVAYSAQSLYKPSKEKTKSKRSISNTPKKAVSKIPQ